MTKYEVVVFVFDNAFLYIILITQYTHLHTQQRPNLILTRNYTN